MSSDNIAIRVQNLSKCYQIYNAPKDRLKQFILPRVRRLLGKQSKEYFQEFWAIKDISFELQKGETIGIVGVNGSGKSTLLQIVCGILTPSGGTVYSNGRIAALLELGSGFNPDFTGRENVYLNGAVLGLSTDELAEKFPDIEDFADIGEFIEQPIKMYSSGMVVRLAFAIAINIEPSILVIDEALAVGDAAFQRKCFARIKHLQENGTTILFVSHDAGAVVELCNRVMLLDQGELLHFGAPKKAITIYHKLLFAPAEKIAAVRQSIVTDLFSDLDVQVDAKSDRLVDDLSVGSNHDGHSTGLEPQYVEDMVPVTTTWYEKNGAEISDPHIETLSGKRVNVLVSGGQYCFVYTAAFLKKAEKVSLGMLIKTVRGYEIGGYGGGVAGSEYIDQIDADSIIRVRMRFNCILTTGDYFLNAGIVGEIDGETGYLHRGIDVTLFRVQAIPGTRSTGVIDFGIETMLS